MYVEPEEQGTPPPKLAETHLLAPIFRPHKNIVCLGKNYAAHAIETAHALGQEEHIPEEPIFFTKAVTTINHPGYAIPYDPAITTQLDWEVELAVIIGRAGRNIDPKVAYCYIFGYTIMLDITARDLQKRHRQYFKGKSLDGTAPLGPWIVTPDELPNPHTLGIRLRVNGETMQEANTNQMIHSIPNILATLSRGMTLEPGDIIATGTPAGVGMAIDPPRFLQPGDKLEAEIDGIGTLTSYIAEPKPPKEESESTE
jgi:2-keto-4-pentenoate hydratase/2-oxohepta-3-ene-1,7-dioic acid hydratase in catechol pathway